MKPSKEEPRKHIAPDLADAHAEELELERAPWRRRQLLRAALGVATGAASTAWAQPGKAQDTASPLIVAQVIDTSPDQLDVSKDLLTGARAAWQEINRQGGLRGRAIQHLVLEVDDSAQSLQQAVDALKKMPQCLLLSGTAADRTATRLSALLRQAQLDMAHVAPWLQNPDVANDDTLFPIFASRRDQIAQALKSLALGGVPDVGVIFGSRQAYAQHRDELELASAALQIRLKSTLPQDDLSLMGRSLPKDTPRILLFIGGTPELVQVLRGLEQQARQHYVLALADVNLQTMLQMGATRRTPVMATQVVPMVNAALPVVKSFRDTLARLYDEAPTPQSLAGYIAARYTFQGLAQVQGVINRQSVLQTFQRRQVTNVGGFYVNIDDKRRGGTYVTQSMITPDGRLIG